MTTKRSAPKWTQRIARQRGDKAKQLLAALATANFVDVSIPEPADLAEWRKTVDFAKRHALVPEGHRLEKQMLDDDLLRIKLVSGVHANTRTAGRLSPVPIPRNSETTHPAVALIRDSEDHLQIPAPLRRRALTLLQAIASELERLGLRVAAEPADAGRHSRDNYYGRMAARRAGRIEAVLHGIACSISVTQNSPLATDPERADRMVIEIWPWPTEGQHRWVDGKRLRIESRLREVLTALDVAAAQRASQREASERDRLRRQVDWEAAMAQAKRLAIQERHLRLLRQSVEAWNFTRQLQDYIQALRGQLAGLPPGDEADNATGWLDWACSFLERYDPIRLLPRLPDRDSEPTIKEIEAI